MGAAPGLRGYFVGAGFNSVGIASAGGAGRALAEWVVEGEATSDLVGGRHPAVRAVPRQPPLAAVPGGRGARPALRRALAEPRDRDRPAVPLLAAARPAGRPRRVVRLEDGLGAAELLRADRGSRRELAYSWGKPPWLDWSTAEQRATREAVAVFDQTSFSKYVVDGPDALEALQWVCANDVDVALGQAVYTPLLDERGRYQSDLTVTRVGPREFLLVSSSATTVRDQDWIRRHLPEGCDARVRDVTTAYAVLGVMGPRSRDLLQRLTDADLGEEAFPLRDQPGGQRSATRPSAPPG